MDTSEKPASTYGSGTSGRANDKTEATARFSEPGFPRSTGIMIIVLFAVIGYALVSTILLQNIVQYSSQANSVLVAVPDDGKPGREAYFNLKITSKVEIDSAKKMKAVNPAKYPIEDILFHQNPVLLVWAMLVCIMVAVAMGSAAYFSIQIYELKKGLNLHARDLVGVWVTPLFW